MVRGGINHSLALKADGSVWAWGYNGYGELGVNDTTRRPNPINVNLLTNVVYIDTGLNHNMALKDDGTLWAWGYNGFGQLGTGDNNNRLEPVEVLDNVATVAAGANYTLALKNDGTLLGWGYNSNYQLGLGDNTQRNTPTIISNISSLGQVVKIAAGYHHSLALFANGTVASWGLNTDGQLGLGNTSTATLPVLIPELDNVINITAGTHHNIALLSDRSLVSWGRNDEGQIGLGYISTSDFNTPSKIADLSSVKNIDTNYYQSIALLTNGQVLTWGDNVYGQLGIGSTSTSANPTIVNTNSSIFDISAGYYHTMAIDTDGTIEAWGRNNNYQLGDNSLTTRTSPIDSSSGLNLLYGATVSTQILTTSEAGDSDSFTIVLDSQPESDVTMAIFSSDVTEGQILISNITFTPFNWNISQTVTVYGIDDNESDGDTAYTIIIERLVTTDSNFNGYDPIDIAVTNLDNDIAVTPSAGSGGSISPDTSQGASLNQTLQFIVTPDQGHYIDDVGGTCGGNLSGNLFTTSPITADCSVIASFAKETYNITTQVYGAGSIDPSGVISVTYGNTQNFSLTPNPGYEIQSVTGCAGSLNGTTYSIGNITSDCTITAFFDEIADSDNDGVNDQEDYYPNDFYHQVKSELIVSLSGAVTSEDGPTSVTSNVRLASRPYLSDGGDTTVTVSAVSLDTSEGSISGSPITFTSTNWNTTQPITITGVDDSIIDGTVAYSVKLTANSAGDLTYNNVTKTLYLRNENDDTNTAPTAVTDTGEFLTVEEGGSFTFNVLDNDTDPDGDNLTAHLLSPVPSGLNLSTNGTLSYQHDGSEQSIVSFTYRARDGTAYSDSVTNQISIIPVNDPARITGDYLTKHNGSGYSQTLSIADDDLYGPHRVYSINVTVNGETQSYNSSTPQNFTSPNGLVLENDGSNNARLRWDNPVDGTYAINWQLVDGEYSDNKAYSLVIRSNNTAPIAQNAAITSNNHIVAYLYDPGWFDNEGDNLTYYHQNLPDWMDADYYESTGLLRSLNGRPNIGDVDTYSNIQLWANDGWGDSSAVNFTISVTNNAPVVSSNISGSVTLDEGALLNLDVDATDVDNDNLTYKVSPLLPGMVFNGSTGVLDWSPLNDQVGSHVLTFSVTDGADTVAAGNKIVTVDNVNNPPVFTHKSPRTRLVLTESYGYTFKATDQDLIHDDALTYSSDNQSTLASLGLSINGSTGQLSGTVSGNQGDTATVIFSVTDSGNDADTTSSLIFSINHAPVITGTPASSVAEGNLYTYTPTSISDNDGDNLSYSIINKPSWLTFSSQTAKITGTPDNNDVGQHSMTLRVSDGYEYTEQQINIEVTDVNNSPQLSGDFQLSVTETQNVFLKPSDIWTFDADGIDELTYTLTNAPAYGDLLKLGVAMAANDTFTASELQNNAIVYLHTGSDTTDDSFVLSVTDGPTTPFVANMAVDVIAQNFAPVINSIAEQTRTLDEDDSIIIDLSSAVINDEETDTLSYLINFAPANDQTTLDSETGQLSYAPQADKNGTAVINWQVSDVVNPPVSSNLVLIINPINDAPTAESVARLTARNTPLTFSLTGQDIDGDRLTATISGSLNNGQIVSNSDGSFTYSPNTDFEGIENLNYFVTDPGGLSSNPQPLSITVSGEPNRAPVALDMSISVIEDQLEIFTLEGSDADNNDVLTYRVTEPQHGKLVLIDSQLGQVKYTPDTNYFGNDSFTYQVVDQTGTESIPATVTINIASVNDIPSILPFTFPEGSPGQLYTYTLNTADVENDLVEVHASGLPDWLNLSNNSDGSATLIGTPENSGIYGPIIFSVKETNTQAQSQSTPQYLVVVGSIPTVLIEPPAGVYDQAQDITLTCKSSDGSSCIIRYDLNNQGQFNVFSSPITINRNSSLKYYAYNNVGQSSISTANYVIDTTDPIVSIDQPAADTFLSGLGDPNLFISATVADTESTIDQVQLQVRNTEDGRYLTEQAGSLILGSEPAWLTMSYSGGSSWQRSVNTSNWPDNTYQVTVKAVNAADREGLASQALYYSNPGDDAYTELSLLPSSPSLKPGNLLSVSGDMSISSNLDLSAAGQPLVLTVTTPSGYTETYDAHTDAQGNYQITGLDLFYETGNYALQIDFAGDFKLAASTASASVWVGDSAGYAVILQGRNDSSEGQDSYDLTTDRIYQQLIDRGLRAEDIYYYSFDNTASGWDGLPSKSTLSDLFNSTLPQKILASPAPLNLFMVDHGLHEQFLLDGTGTVITPVELDNWLDQLESGLSADILNNQLRRIIIGSCYSGSFIPALSQDGRIVITSAAADEQSYKGPDEYNPDTLSNIRSGEFFIDTLVQQWQGNTDLAQAFSAAASQTWDYTRDRKRAGQAKPIAQNPQLDDNGDSIGSRELNLQGDGDRAIGQTLGIANAQVNTQQNTVPDSLFVSAYDTSTIVTLALSDSSNINTAWVEIKAPSYQYAPDQSSFQLSNDLTKVSMTYNAVLDRWEATLTGLVEPGRYDLFYFTRDNAGELDNVLTGWLIKDTLGNQAPSQPILSSPSNNAQTDTSVRFDWEGSTDAENDRVTYQLEIAQDYYFNAVVFRQGDINGTQSFVTGQILDNQTTYYWRVWAIDERGGRRASAVSKFKAQNTNGQRTILYGVVQDQQLPVVDVTIDVSGNRTTTDENGQFILVVAPGTFDVTATRSGYADQGVNDITLKANQAASISIAMNANGETANAQQISIDEDTPYNGQLTSSLTDTVTYIIDQMPVNGALNANADGSFTYTPDSEFSGTDSFAFYAQSGATTTTAATVDITINPVNDSPELNAGLIDDLPEIALGQSRYDGTNLYTLLNQAITDADDVIRQVQITSLNNNSLGSWQKSSDYGSTWQLVSVTDVLQVSSRYRLRFNPTANGQASLTLKAFDGNSLSINNAVLYQTVLAQNSAPTISDVALNTAEDTAVHNLTLLPNAANDDDEDTLSYQRISYTGDGELIIDKPSGAIHYYPALNFNGIETAVIRITDGEGYADAILTINVSSINDAPQAIGYSRTISGPTSLTLTGSDDSNDELTVTITTPPLHGSLANQGNNTYLYTPDENYDGSDNIGFIVTDSNALDSLPAQVNLTVVANNTPPQAVDNNLTATEDTPLNGQLYGTDAEGPVSYAIASQPSHGSVTLLGSGSAYFNYIPDANYHGPDSFTFTVSDNQGATDIGTINLTIDAVNDIPQINGAPITLVRAGNAYSFKPQVVHPDYDEPLVFSINKLPAWDNVSFNASTGQLSGTPQNGEEGITTGIVISVADNDDSVSLLPFDLTVAPNNAEPFSSASLAAGFYPDSQTVTLSCLADVPPCTIAYRLDDGGFSDYTGPILVDETATLEFYAIDNNETEETVHHFVHYVIDRNSPQVAINIPENDAALSTIYQISGTIGDDNSSISSIELSITDGVNYLNGQTLQNGEAWNTVDVVNGQWFYFLTDNILWDDTKTYAAVARGTDQAGNRGSASVLFTVNPSFIPVPTSLTGELTESVILDGDEITVSGRLTRLPDIGLDLSGKTIQLTLKDSLGNSLLQWSTQTYDRFGRYQFAGLPIGYGKGSYQLSVDFASTDLLESSSLTLPLVVADSAGFAILIDTADTAASRLTQSRLSYYLQQRGLDEADIHRIDTTVNASAIPSSANVQAAIETWALNKLAQAGPLYLFILGDITADTLTINGQNFTLAELDQWLNALESTLPTNSFNEARVVIHAGSNGDALVRRLSESGRTIVVTSDRNEHALGPVEDTALNGFSAGLGELMRYLERGYNFADSLKRSQDKLTSLTAAQGLIEDNGDGIDDSANPTYSQSLYLGYGFTPYRPLIDWIQPQQILGQTQASATLATTVTNENNVAGNPWAIVIKPDGQSKYVNLARDEQAGLYSGDFDQVSDIGLYSIHYYVRDTRGNVISDHQVGSLYKADPNNTPPFGVNLISPTNGAETSTLALFKWQQPLNVDNLADADADTVSYNLVITDTSGQEVFRQEQILKTYYLLNTGILADLTTYYWSIESVDERGGLTVSSPYMFNTDNTNGIPGILQGIIYSDLDFSRLASATINSLVNSDNIAAISDGLGEYIALLSAGLANVTASKTGFANVNNPSVSIQTGQTTILNMFLPSADVDSDGDGIKDSLDNCDAVPNPDQADSDNDSVGDLCLDSDNDGIANILDNCPDASNPDQSDFNNDGLGDLCSDVDNDGILDSSDNCPLISNSNQKNTDGDSAGDVCDNDDDNDGLTDSQEAALGTNRLLKDTDNDGTNDKQDNCPIKANASQADSDNDGIGDVCDDDSDNDGLTDTQEINMYGTDPRLADTDNDGYNDKDEIDAGTDPLDQNDFPRRSKAWKAIIPLILGN